MENYKEIIDEAFGEDLISMVISNNKPSHPVKRVNIRPLLIRGNLMFQFEYEYPNKVTHKNLDREEGQEEVLRLREDGFRQNNIFTRLGDYDIRFSKKNKIFIGKKPASKSQVDLSHNREKTYIIEDGKYCDFLHSLGVMNKDNRVSKRHYDKFRQINRFLEMVDDVIKDMDFKDGINIIDFGCGKSYLTFGLYYYLVKLKGLNVKITGLDLKEDVIDFCNKTARDLDYKDLTFKKGDIKDYFTSERVDMVVSLHACDIATDEALVKSIKWGLR